jgi:Flp pilus assembly protein TadB
MRLVPGEHHGRTGLISGADPTVPRIRWRRLLLLDLLQVVLVGTMFAAYRLAGGAPVRGAAEAGLALGVLATVSSTGLDLYRRRQRYRANPYHLSREQREEAADATSPRHPVPTDPRVRHEALRLARDLHQQDGGGTRTTFVLLVVVVAGFVVAGLLGSHWWLLAGAALVPLLLLAPLHRGRDRRRAELERLVAGSGSS